jgi:hypothetical protein
MRILWNGVHSILLRALEIFFIILHVYLALCKDYHSKPRLLIKNIKRRLTEVRYTSQITNVDDFFVEAFQ